MKSIALSCLAALLLLTACGIKPADVDPPQGRAADKFPHTYPNPATDPKPQ